MQITVNGEARDVPDGATVADLVDRQGLRSAACAVEINRALTPRARWGEQRLNPGDAVEIVTLVGGG